MGRVRQTVTTVRMFADLRITASGLPKTSGTIYVAIMLDRAGDTNHGKYWSTASGGSWSSSPTYPTMTYAAGCTWYYDLPLAAITNKHGGRIVLVDASDNLATPASETTCSGNKSEIDIDGFNQNRRVYP